MVVKTWYAPYEKLVEENHLEILILSFKAASELGPVLWAPHFCPQKLQENQMNFPQKQELFHLSSPDATPSHGPEVQKCPHLGHWTAHRGA